MRARIGLMLVLGLLTGCATVPVVQIPVTDLALAYADAKAEIAVAAFALGQACESKRLTPEVCQRLGQGYERAKALEVQARLALANPKRPPDPAVIREYIATATSLLGTVAGMVGKGALGIP
jgi:hypothetical protein